MSSTRSQAGWRLLFLLLLTIFSAACNDRKEAAVPEADSMVADERFPAQDHTAVASADSAAALVPEAKPARPMADAMPPARLAPYLPNLPTFEHGEQEPELKIRKNFNASKIGQTYTQGNKKVYIEINDFAYVEHQYAPFAEKRDGYLQDDSFERTESTKIKGFDAIQSVEKKGERISIFVFPGDRYMVKFLGDNMTDLKEARAIVEGMDLEGLSRLQ